MAGDNVVFTYDSSKNPDDLHLEGVPLRDLTQTDIDRLTQHQLDGVIESTFYTKTGRMRKRDTSEMNSSTLASTNGGDTNG